jgi:hypothetical protein
MALRILVVIAIVALEVWGSAVLSAQDQASQLSVEALFPDPPRPKTPTRLWLRIRNRTRRIQVLCRSSWGYTWISPDPQEAPAIEEQSSLDGCGDERHDPFWLLLPGESRFDSYEVTGPAQPNSMLEVEIEIIHHAIDAPGPGEHRALSWKGRLSDAIALGAKLRGR